VANDQVQKLREAIVAVLDTRAELVAITGRALNNIVAWGGLGELSDDDRAAGILAFQVIDATDLAADGKPRRAIVQFGAVAAEESTANEMLGVVENVFDAPAFLALVPPIDAWAENRSRRPMPFDDDEELARADLDVTLTVTFA
jgi:hypothetical protein